MASMTRIQAELATVVNLLGIGTQREINDLKYASDMHPLIVDAHRAGFSEAAVTVQQISRTLAQTCAETVRTLAELGMESQPVANWQEATAHLENIVCGKSLPLHDGANHISLFDVEKLTTTPIVKPLFFKTYENNAKGVWVEKTNFISSPGASLFDFVVAVKIGQKALHEILSNRKVRLAADIKNAEIRDGLKRLKECSAVATHFVN